jgi:hypothetical protein
LSWWLVFYCDTLAPRQRGLQMKRPFRFFLRRLDADKASEIDFGMAEIMDLPVRALQLDAGLRQPGIERRLQLWPDKSIGSQSPTARMPNPCQYRKRLDH